MPAITEPQYRFWDLLIKASAALLFIVPLMLGYSQWLASMGLEARKPFLQKRLELCVTAADAAGTIATSSQRETIARTTAELEKLYWGSIAIVDDEALSKAMLLFIQTSKKEPNSDLTGAAEAVAHRCRDLLRAAWDIRSHWR